MNGIEFEFPFLLVLLVLIICIYWCPLSVRRYIFPHTHLFSLSTHWLNKQRVLYSLIFASLVVALASPISYEQKLSDKRKGRDLVFVLDTSGSMAENGFDEDDEQKSKFEVLQEVLAEFIKHRYDDNVGVSIFGSFAYSAVPLSYDMQAINYLLNFIDVGIAGDSTAIGEGLHSALEILKVTQAKERVIILVTDGYQNSGSISIRDAVKRASDMQVRIYTIGIGKKGSYDEKLLLKIAEDSDGKSFEARDADMLKKVYKEIDALEPSEIRSAHYLNKTSLFVVPLVLASLLLFFLLYSNTRELK